MAKGEPARLHATLLTSEDLPRMFVLRSHDAGATWSRTELSRAAEILDVTLLAASPAGADELLLRVRYINGRNGEACCTATMEGSLSCCLIGSAPCPTRHSPTTARPACCRIGQGVARQHAGAALAPVGAIDGMTDGARFDQQLLLSGYRVIDGSLNMMVWSSDVAITSPLQRWMGFDEVTSAKSCPAPSPVGEQCASDWATGA